MEIQVRIHTKTPVILPCTGDASDLTATQEFFSGSVLRGILARQFIGKRKLDDAICALFMPIRTILGTIHGR